jgi:hemerythrin-like domain-containing protein
MNAIELLERQHREVEALFHDMERTKQDDVQKLRQLCARLADTLTAHFEIEEQYFYPAAKVGELSEMVEQAAVEHFEAKKLVAQLMEAEPGSKEFFLTLAELKDAVINHVEEEEGEMLPAARKVLSREELSALGEDMATRFEELMAEEPRKDISQQLEAPAQI